MLQSPSHRRVLALALAALGPVSIASAQPTFTPLGTLGGSSASSDAWAVSRDGSTTVGGSPSPDSTPGDSAFKFVAPGPIGVLAPGVGNDLPGGNFRSTARAVSANGSIIVGLSAYSGVRTHAFRIGPGDSALVDLGNIAPQTPPIVATSDISAALGISDDGSVIVGRGFRQSANTTEACYWLNGAPGATGIGDLAGGLTFSVANGVSGNGLVIVGEGAGPSGREAFRWTLAGGMVGLGDDPGGAFDSTAYAASFDGSVTVGYVTTAAGFEAARWSGTILRALGDLAGGPVESVATAVSANGAVVVGTGNAGRPDPTFPAFAIGEAFVWTPRHGMRRLEDLLGAALPAGWIPSTANGVTDTPGATIIVGSGLNPAGDNEAYIAAIPVYCPADVNDSGSVTVQDIFDFLSAYFASAPLADVNGNGSVTLQDIFDFLAFYFGGC